MDIYYTATHTFNPSTDRVQNGFNLNWERYLACCRITHIKEVVTLDNLLAERILDQDYQNDSAYMVWGSPVPGLYNSLEFLVKKLEDKNPATYNLLAVTKEPASPCEEISLEGFYFVGYDLMDVEGDISTLTDVSGYSYIKDPNDINNLGLIKSHHRAFEIKAELQHDFAGEPHTDCNVWGIWRMGNR